LSGTSIADPRSLRNPVGAKRAIATLEPQPNDADAAHVALVVEDLDGALRRPRDHRFRSAPVLLDDHDGRWKDVKIAYVDDPDGCVIEPIRTTA
jgi:hypothetical protein